MATHTPSISDGTVNAPGFYFRDDTNLGFYRAAANTIGSACNGTNDLLMLDTHMVFTTPSLEFAAGSAAAPSMTFNAYPAYGMYHNQASSVWITTNGTGNFRGSAGGGGATISLLPVTTTDATDATTDDGTTGSVRTLGGANFAKKVYSGTQLIASQANGFAFSGDTTTGLFHSGSAVQLKYGGTVAQSYNSSARTINTTCVFPATAAPQVCLSSTNSGLYRSAANRISIDSNTVERLQISTSYKNVAGGNIDMYATGGTNATEYLSDNIDIYSYEDATNPGTIHFGQLSTSASYGHKKIISFGSARTADVVFQGFFITSAAFGNTLTVLNADNKRMTFVFIYEGSSAGGGWYVFSESNEANWTIT